MLREMVDSSLSRYFPGVSPSSRSGMTSVSLLNANEFGLLPAPGESCLAEYASESCLNLVKLRNPPKLDRPVVDVEFLVLPDMSGGVSTEWRPREELVVDARSLIPNRMGGCSGDDVDELRERVEPRLTSSCPDCSASANGDWPFGAMTVFRFDGLEPA